MAKSSKSSSKTGTGSSTQTNDSSKGNVRGTAQPKTTSQGGSGGGKPKK